MGNTPKLKFNLIQDKQTAQSLINKAELVDFYLEECYDDKLNSIARRNLSYSANSVSSLNIEIAKKVIENTSLSKQLLYLGEVNIIQLMPSADAGMPHTRPGNIICCPDISSLSESTLIHELWHIHQRSFPDYWLKIFKKIGWTIWRGKLPDKLENVRRYNPDTIDEPYWIFNDKWVSVPVFKDITHPTVNDVEICFYNPYIDYYTRQVPEELSSYTELSGISLEHPREIAAYILSGFNKSSAYKDLLNAMNSMNSMNAMNARHDLNKNPK